MLLRRLPSLGLKLLAACLACSVVGAPAWAADDEPGQTADEVADEGSLDAEAAAELEFSEELGAQDAARSTTARRGHRVVQMGVYVSQAGDTLRSVAYRYCTSPVMVAMANGMAFDPDRNEPLRPGTKVKVPIARRSPSGFQGAEQLHSGPGIDASKTDRNYGRPHFVARLRAALLELHKRWPTRHPALIGSLSRPGGGRLGNHKSHRSGQDVDIGYFTMAANRKEWGVPPVNQIDYQRLWFFIDTMERTGVVAAIYMAPGIQRRLYQHAVSQGVSEARLRTLLQYGPKGVKGALIRNEPGHRDHFHLRLLCPEDYVDMVGST